MSQLKIQIKSPAKRCTKCKKFRSITDFAVRKERGGKRRTICIYCRNKARQGKNKDSKKIQNKTYRAKNIGKVETKREEWRRRNPDKVRQYQRTTATRNRERLKRELIEAYGGECSCPGCTVKEPQFLDLHHVNGRAIDCHGRTYTGARMWALARREGWPDKYALLCKLCNGTQHSGKDCPRAGKPHFN